MLSLAVVLLCLSCASVAKADSVAVNYQDYLPDNVSTDRWGNLVDQSLAFWGLGNDGATTAIAGDHDSIDTLGFTPFLDDATLGLTSFWTHSVYKTWKVKKCHRTASGKRRCHWVKRRKYLYDLIDENDTAINANEPWNPGPNYPPIDQYDLESVLLHELDHYANPDRPHQPRCSGAALATPLDTGEWWRGYNDWFMYGCDLGKRGGGRITGRVGHFSVVVHRGPPQYMDRGAGSAATGRKLALP
jgi:hypothetical protein